MNTLQKLITSSVVIGVVITILTFAGKYVIGQEVQKEVAPVKAQLANILFEERYKEAQELKKECLKEHSERYCEVEDQWRWEVYYPYLDCIAGLAFKDREPTCGPEPTFAGD
jgi:hypothetical protein